MATNENLRDFTFDHERPFQGKGFDPDPNPDAPVHRAGLEDLLADELDSDSRAMEDGQTMEMLGAATGASPDRRYGTGDEEDQAQYLAMEAERARQRILDAEKDED